MLIRQWYIYIETCTFASNTLYRNNPLQQGCPLMQTYQSLLISTLHMRFNTILWHPYPIITDADMQVFLETKHTYLDRGGFSSFVYTCSRFPYYIIDLRCIFDGQHNAPVFTLKHNRISSITQGDQNNTKV